MSKKRLAVLAVLIAVGVAGSGRVVRDAAAQTPSFAPPGVHFQIDGPSQRLEMVVASSRILTLQQRIPRLLVSNPEVIRATPLSPNQIQVSSLQPGVTQLNVWDEDQRLYTIDVVVYADARELEDLIRTEFPDAAVRVRPLANSVYLTGYVPSANMVSSIVRMAEDYYPSVINNLSVGGVQQIMLKVKVMEVSRTKLRSAGFDWAVIDGEDFIVQSVSGLIGSATVGVAGASGPAAAGTGGDTVRFGIVDGNNAFFGFIEALRQNNLIKVLAEPTLVTVSGRPASFNSGGEFPIIVPQSLGTVSIEYRQFGTRVDFVPLVLGNGNVRLEVRPQISEIDAARSVTINNITVPGLRTRWVDTAVEMKAGQTLALAGLIQNRVEAENKGLPWLGELPWFGSAFRRVTEQVNEIELLIMVTPEFVGPLDPHEVPPLGPGEATTSPTDVELFWRGYLEVPRCCTDGNCPNCRHGLPAGAVIEEVRPGGNRPAPPEVNPPRPPAGQDAGFDASARRGNPNRTVSAQQPAIVVPNRTMAPHEPVGGQPSSTAGPAGPVRASVYGPAEKPAPHAKSAVKQASGQPKLIGAFGYDVLK